MCDKALDAVEPLALRYGVDVEIVVAENTKGEPVTAEDMQAAGAMAAIL